MPNALLVCPEFPPSYWGYTFALDFVGKRASMPPLGLLTVAAMFPDDYQLRVVDMNVESLEDSDIEWADMVLTSTMIVQKHSLTEVIGRCNRAGVPIVCGGPHPTTFHEEISAAFAPGTGVDHFVLGEVEDIFPVFLRDLQAGNAQRMYREDGKPDVSKTLPPRYDLIDIDLYGSMAIQFSRGCPFDCEFCDITKLFGRVPRTKTNAQLLAELDLLHGLGWRGAVFIVDDNFIGNKRAAMSLLPELQKWQVERGFPFRLFTEASMNVVEVPGMLQAMSDAGFDMMFVGIESPNEVALKKTHKGQNTSRKPGSDSYLLRSVREIQRHGIEVAGGFIIGLDGDEEFDSHLEFIQAAGIPMAMTGLLTAFKGTNLYDRLAREGRLIDPSEIPTGNNTDVVLGFVPLVPADQLIAEYRRVIRTLYEPSLSSYFDRCWTLVQNLPRTTRSRRRLGARELRATVRSLGLQLFSRQGPAYAWFLAKVILRRPKVFGEAIRLAIMGYHFEKVTSLSLEGMLRRVARVPRKEAPSRRQAPREGRGAAAIMVPTAPATPPAVTTW